MESAFFPGAIYLLSAWYTKNELGKRIGGLYVGQQVGNAFGGLIAAGCLKLDGRMGLSGWRWLFIIEGAATVGIALLSALILPEYPYNARLLTPLERKVAVWRLEKEAGAAEGSETVGTWAGFLQSFKDPKLYLLIFCNMMSQTQGSIANFFPTIGRSDRAFSELTSHSQDAWLQLHPHFGPDSASLHLCGLLLHGSDST